MPRWAKDYFEKRDRERVVRRALSRLQHIGYRVLLEEGGRLSPTGEFGRVMLRWNALNGSSTP